MINEVSNQFALNIVCHNVLCIIHYGSANRFRYATSLDFLTPPNI